MTFDRNGTGSFTNRLDFLSVSGRVIDLMQLVQKGWVYPWGFMFRVIAVCTVPEVTKQRLPVPLLC